MKIIDNTIYYLRLIFYKIKWIDNTEGNDDSNEYGYYLVKRQFVWIVFCPLIIVAYAIYATILLSAEYFPELSNYKSQWVMSSDKTLTRKEYKKIFNRLF